MGYDIVRVQLSGGDWLRLQIMAERRTDGGMDVDDFAEVSRAVAAFLDVEEPVARAFTLEVGSPGIDRPLTPLAALHRSAAFAARLDRAQPCAGTPPFLGGLRGSGGRDDASAC